MSDTSARYLINICRSLGLTEIPTIEHCLKCAENSDLEGCRGRADKFLEIASLIEMRQQRNGASA